MLGLRPPAFLSCGFLVRIPRFPLCLFVCYVGMFVRILAVHADCLCMHRPYACTRAARVSACASLLGCRRYIQILFLLHIGQADCNIFIFVYECLLLFIPVVLVCTTNAVREPVIHEVTLSVCILRVSLSCSTFMTCRLSCKRMSMWK